MKLFENIMMVMMLSCAALPSDLSAMKSGDVSSECGAGAPKESKEPGDFDTLKSAGFVNDLSDDVELSLEELNLTETGATADLVRAIVQRCSQLKKLDLNRCDRAAEFIEGLADDVALVLEELGLGCTNATADLVRVILQRCPTLKKLHLECCGRAAEFIEGLSEDVELPLEELGLRGTEVTAAELDLSWMYATAEEVYEIVQRCPQLKKLDLKGCDGVAGLIEALSNDIDLPLEELGLGWTRATAEEVRSIVEQCPSLKRLNLEGFRGAAAFIEGLSDDIELLLEELDLSLTDATAEQVRAILQRCPKLKKLILCKNEDVAGFASELSDDVQLALEELELGATEVTAAEVRAILQRCPNLKKLKLLGVFTIGSGAAGFIEGLPDGVGLQLEELVLGITNVTADQRVAIRARFPGCKIRFGY